MKKKLSRILLVDDNEADNYYHQMIIEEVECAEEVIEAENGLEALNYLTSLIEHKHPQPELILLDINMPKMNGWEFLEQYQKLEENQKSDVVIIMVTTSLNPDDQKKADSMSCVAGFLNKPLTRESLQELLAIHYPEYLS